MLVVAAGVRHLINGELLSKAFGEKALLSNVSLGIDAGDHIGVVGRNGAGKSTLLAILAGESEPDAGRVSVANDVRIGYLRQNAPFDPDQTVIAAIVGDETAQHTWASQVVTRTVIEELIGSTDERVLTKRLGSLSGGERRRVELARLLISDLDVLLMDEPTNHLDVEIVTWLAEFLKAKPQLAVVVVTHDRWFLDEVCDSMWEVVDGSVEEYDGGYSAFVLAKAERQRQAAASESRRNNLLRKELAWLRRGAPARTSKPKFRIDAANELIRNEPPPRDDVELLAFAKARLGKTVYELKDVSVGVADRVLADHVTWNIGPGERIGILGSNGSGKTTMIRTILGEQRPVAGKIVTGQTVKAAYLSQHLDELDPSVRVLEAVSDVAERVDLGKGRELTATQLCERLGFDRDGQWTPVGHLSGGERRRLQLTRLLMSAPNVLVLDEPTNDFDVETLSALEDLLDGFAGTVIVISHDRYFLERVCERMYAMLPGEVFRDLPGGIDEYVRVVRSGGAAPVTTQAVAEPKRSSAAQKRLDDKLMAKLERQIAKLTQRESELHALLAEHATDYERVTELNAELSNVIAEREQLEEQWLEVASA